MNPFDRVALLIAAACTSTWQNTIMLVKPETVLRWRRQGFQLLWRRKSHSKTMAHPFLGSLHHDYRVAA